MLVPGLLMVCLPDPILVNALRSARELEEEELVVEFRRIDFGLLMWVDELVGLRESVSVGGGSRLWGRWWRVRKEGMGSPFDNHPVFGPSKRWPLPSTVLRLDGNFFSSLTISSYRLISSFLVHRPHTQPHSVVVTGTFDDVSSAGFPHPSSLAYFSLCFAPRQWSGNTHHLTQREDGFEGTVDLEYESSYEFKFGELYNISVSSSESQLMVVPLGN